MDDLNERDPFEDLLRKRAPGPGLSDGLLDRLEERARWSRPPRRIPVIPILAAAAAVAICLWLAFLSEPPPSLTQPPAPPAGEQQLGPVPAPPPVVAPRPGEEFLDRADIGFYSATLARAEPAFRGGLDIGTRAVGDPGDLRERSVPGESL